MFRWRFIPEHELVPYHAVNRLPAAGIMVLAPHPDDEVFGCGGIVALASDAGVPVSIVIATDGGQGGDPLVRERESRSAVRVLAGAGKAPDLAFWRYPDRGLNPERALVDRIRAQLAQRQPDWLLAPSPFEVHPDHRAACLAAIEAAKDSAATLGFYEIGQPLLPNCFVDITPVVARKQAAMACFASQISGQRYDEQVAAMNRVRSYTLGPAVEAAEALWFPRLARTGGAQAVLDELTARLALHLGLDDRQAPVR